MRSILVLLLSLWGASGAAQGETPGRILSVLGTGPTANLVLIDRGSSQGVVSGEIFRVVRVLQQGLQTPFETGVIKILSVQPEQAIGEIISSETAKNPMTLSTTYPGVMAGDYLKTQKIAIAPVKVLTPEIAVRYASLFDDPKALPSSYELTAAGKKSLKEIAEQISWARAGMLLIEGHTDRRGSRGDNQVESYQRALTVRQYLIEELGFDEARVAAIGLGEGEPAVDVTSPRSAELSRRIVFKVVPMPSH